MWIWGYVQFRATQCEYGELNSGPLDEHFIAELCLLLHHVIFCLFGILGGESRALYILDKCNFTELYLQLPF